ncbi:MAG: UDP-N-acetylmuramate dehydrogenase [Candidatus Brocadiae bacterium]|nr:UDP-N-acetylmuramate dehydrogenase [Candidatus Brocadiia bacterium]
MILKRDEPLAPRTSWKVGGRAEYFFIPERHEEVPQAMSYCRAKGLELRVLGGGTNLLVRDEGCPAVLSLEKFRHTDGYGPFARAEAGASFPAFVKKVADNACGGSEALAGIPGTVGGALVMNAGGHHGEIGEFVRRVKCVEPDGRIVTLDRDACGFRYRDSDLKHRVILSVDFEFTEGDRAVIRSRMREIVTKKRASQPLHGRSAGCVFRNPPGAAAGRLIDECGFKGARVGGAVVSTVHANFLMNEADASAGDLLALIHQVQNRVRESRGVDLELEIKVW